MTVTPTYYPIFLNLTNKKCLIVGGGKVGLEKVMPLLKAGADITVIAENFIDDFFDLAACHSQLQLQHKTYSYGEAQKYYMVITATGKTDIDYSIYRECHEHQILVNAADYIPGCDFILPARFQSGDIQIAVSTAGSSPALATWLRDRIANYLGEGISLLAEMLKQARMTLKENNGMPTKEKWKALLDSGLLEEINQGDIESVKNKITQFLQENLSSQQQ
jgi:siroheme synthase-like protein